MTDVITLIRRSAKGDLEAHRELAQIGIAQGLAATERGDDPFIPYYEAAIFARMAASSGLLPDRARLLSVLAICSELAARDGLTDDADTYEAESLGVAELVADGDDLEAAEFAAQVIANSGQFITPELAAMAKEFKELWGAE